VFEEKNFQEVRELVQKTIDLDDNIVVLAGIKGKRRGRRSKDIICLFQSFKI